MKKTLWLLIGVVLMTGALAWGGTFEDVVRHPHCKYCGMERDRYAYSRLLIEYADGAQSGVCSLHCAAVDLASRIDTMPVSIRVGNFMTHKLIDAETASWILGGRAPGVMTLRAKWAFDVKPVAEQFARDNGGQVVDFEGALQASYADMYSDTRMIREKRRQMPKMD